MGPSVGVERVRGQLEGLGAAGLDLPTFTRGALEVLRRAMPFDAACLATVDPATELLTCAVKWGNLDDAHDLAWARHEYEVDDVYDFKSVLRSPGLVAGLHTETGGDVARSPRFSELFRPVWDFSDEMRAGIRVDGASWGGIALFHEGRRTFSHADQAFVSSLMPLLGRGLRAAVVSGAAAALEVAVDGPAVVVVDADDAVTQANVGAAARIADLGGGPLGESRLPACLETLVAAARRFAAGGSTSAPRIRLRTLGGRWVVAHASPLLAVGGPPGGVVLTIEEARPPEIVPLLVAAHGLTARERDVVTHVLAGTSTTDIAAAMHLSTWTVQDHLKKVFEKMGVRSRRELVARVNTDHYVPRLVAGDGVAPSGWFTDPA